MNLSQLTTEYNLRAVAAGKKAIKGFKCSLADAQKRVNALPAVGKKAAKPKAEKKAGEAKPTISSRCLELFAAGKDNDAVWQVVSEEFDMTDDHRYYVSWYRRHFTKKGLLK